MEEKSNRPKQTDVIEHLNLSGLTNGNGTEYASSLSNLTSLNMPAMSSPIKNETASDVEIKEYWKDLRKYFRNGQLSGKLKPVPSDCIPVPLFPFSQSDHIRNDYPVWVGSGNDLFRNETCMSVADLLNSAFSDYTNRGHQAKILGDNLIRIEKHIKKVFGKKDIILPVKDVLNTAFTNIAKKLNLKGDDAKQFKTDLQEIRKLLPDNGFLIPFSPVAPLLLIRFVLEQHHFIRHTKYKAELNQLKAKLKELLLVEDRKRASSAKKEKQDFSSQYIRNELLDAVRPVSGSVQMPAERYERIKKAYQTLNQADSLLFDHTANMISDQTIQKHFGFNLQTIFPSATIIHVKSEHACAKATAVFDALFADATKVIAAKRIASLELAGKYVDEVHTDYFKTFSWQSFTAEELNTCIPVFLLLSNGTLVNEQLSAYSNLITTGRPVKTLILENTRSLTKKFDKEHASAYLQEPAVFAMAHRNTFTLQNTSVFPLTFYQNITKGVQSSAPTLFSVILSEESKNETEAFIKVSAARESRIFPEFLYDVERGDNWSTRFDITDNPQHDKTWPVYSFEFNSEDDRQTMEIAFTVADYVLYSGDKGFAEVPEAYCSEHLIPLDEYFDLKIDETYSKVPFIWAEDKKGRLHRVAIPFWLVSHCRERTEFWNYLQEIGGVKSYYINKAVEEAIENKQKQFEQEKEALIQSYEEKVERAKQEAAGIAMDKLASVLLDIDQLSSIPVTEKKTRADVSESEDKTQVHDSDDSSEESQEEEQDVMTAEAWIESVKCTSCNDCIDLNAAIFKYNNDKQAYIADASAGPFAHIVQAAENCPAKCIHPGSPLNPDEPHLDELIKRAEPLN